MLHILSFWDIVDELIPRAHGIGFSQHSIQFLATDYNRILSKKLARREIKFIR